MMRFYRSSLHWLWFALMLMLVGCSGYDPEPRADKNFVFDETQDAPPQLNHDAFHRHVAAQLVILQASTHPDLVRFRQNLEKLRSLPALQQLVEVNNVVNDTVTYLPHELHHPQPSGWGDAECVIQHGGDCVDYAQLKYLALRYLGWQACHLRVVIGWNQHPDKRVLHAVLVAQLEGGAQLLLDNLREYPTPPTDATSFKPLYAYNEDNHFTCQRDNRTPPDTTPAAAGH